MPVARVRRVSGGKDGPVVGLSQMQRQVRGVVASVAAVANWRDEPLADVFLDDAGIVPVDATDGSTDRGAVAVVRAGAAAGEAADRDAVDTSSADAATDDMRRTCPTALKPHPPRLEDDPATIPQPSLAYLAFKRGADVAISSAVIVVGALPTAALCLAISLDSPGPPIFRQRRVGRDGRPLTIYKLRTMYTDAARLERYLTDEQIRLFKRERKLEDDPRITRVGMLLRRTSLDELPQFLNVLAGSMSLVGPRPIMHRELLDHYTPSERRVFLSVSPGLTGYWQVFARNEAEYDDSRRQRMELSYIIDRSLGLDVSIILRTFGSIVARTGR